MTLQEGDYYHVTGTCPDCGKPAVIWYLSSGVGGGIVQCGWDDCEGGKYHPNKATMLRLLAEMAEKEGGAE